MTSVSNIRERSIYSFVLYDLPAPDFANVTELWFSREKRSECIKDELWRLEPERMPRFEVRSKDMKGKMDDRGAEFSFVWTSSSSVARGSTLRNPCSCWKSAGRM